MTPETGKKRTLDAFFAPTPSKKVRVSETSAPPTTHEAYPFPISQLPTELVDTLGFSPENEGEVINNQPHLDLLYFKPYIPKSITSELFTFLRSELPFYRVKYTIKRYGVSTDINTPRYTTVFGIDNTTRFDNDGNPIDAKTERLLPSNHFRCKPRPIPECLEALRRVTEGTTGQTFNFCLVNYYATGDDSISYHSDDERFLGTNPAIASFSLGEPRDFLLKHKPPATGKSEGKQAVSKPLKFTLGAGDMILMKGETQANWLHSIPKRKGIEVGKGRINITFRKAMVKEGTENYYNYNVGNGPVHKWDSSRKEMVPWTASS
ncbi:DNA repair family protein [Microthyrium microscopicum]|uniref:DNA repair family protein n=1 Tax=Microthyrium microscopicum TaxID=703497 RepID=A0A6A6UQP1_9PEZI|nr:DNA repair family protein [Microthyrium microscopicum]